MHILIHPDLFDDAALPAPTKTHSEIPLRQRGQIKLSYLIGPLYKTTAGCVFFLSCHYVTANICYFFTGIMCSLIKLQHFMLCFNQEPIYINKKMNDTDQCRPLKHLKTKSNITRKKVPTCKLDDFF